MDKFQKTLLISLILVSAVSWLILKDRSDMTITMSYDPLTILLFTASWTAGMAAMMFPAISPVVFLYSKLARNNNMETLQIDKFYPLKMILFVGSYLAVWALTGVVLLLTRSVLMNSFLMEADGKVLNGVYGIVLIVAGAYQFSPLKTRCIGYCESPMSFFMRRWKGGTVGATMMGTYHGLYCVGCCWSYFLLMVALGWMNLAWMGLFAGIIFAERIWSRGVLISRTMGVGFVILALFMMLAPNLPFKI